MRYLVRAIRPVQGTNHGLAVPRPCDSPNSGYEPQACGTSSERIHQNQGTNHGLAVPLPSESTWFRVQTEGLQYLIRANLPGSGHEPRACGTSSERSARFWARTEALRYLIRAIRPVQATNRRLAVPHPQYGSK
ncbi:hypothetical protein [Ammoniphilus sp. YIM 78166]|uniref:hypothetical protein n=1 Tax=Ammoniphilus sp. YIM 78166 TaxID=1644106 RepID=UPI00106F9100|nr:hypothetical protein [Ammoniphilus sp. YIM 78166]